MLNVCLPSVFFYTLTLVLQNYNPQHHQSVSPPYSYYRKLMLVVPSERYVMSFEDVWTFLRRLKNIVRILNKDCIMKPI
jgi:hypothetical protein